MNTVLFLLSVSVGMLVGRWVTIAIRRGYFTTAEALVVGCLGGPLAALLICAALVWAADFLGLP